MVVFECRKHALPLFKQVALTALRTVFSVCNPIGGDRLSGNPTLSWTVFFAETG